MRYQKYEIFKLTFQLLLSKYNRFQLPPVVFLIPLKAKGHTVPHLKALRYCKYKTRVLSCISTFRVCQEAFKSDNLLHKWGFVFSQMKTTVLNQHEQSKKLFCLFKPIKFLG